jgi:hypothetical protein
MKKITSRTHEEITRLFYVIERLSLQHIPFDEVQGFWAAKKWEVGRHSQLRKIWIKEQMSLPPCHLASIYFTCSQQPGFLLLNHHSYQEGPARNE